MSIRHVPVLLQEVLEGLKLSVGMKVVDATLGEAGYSGEICKQIGETGTLIALDADADAVVRGQEILCDIPCTKHVLEYNFKDVGHAILRLGIDKIDGAVFDLGMSSIQLESSGRGFSFGRDEPLLMTFAESPGPGDLTARYVINEWSEQALSDVFYGYGEEKHARGIARAIVAARRENPIETTRQLVSVIEEIVPKRGPGRSGKIHPATRVFQALRIVVNGELQALEKGIAGAFGALRPGLPAAPGQPAKTGGRMAVVSFHSLEDRLVKRFFKEQEEKGSAVRITKKPIVPAPEEVARNPRSRSAKLRILEKS